LDIFPDRPAIGLPDDLLSVGCWLTSSYVQRRLTMKKLVYLTISVQLAVFLGACATATPIASATPTASEEMINPGDKIGDFLITIGDSEDVIFVTKLHCPFDNSTGKESFEQPVGTMVNVGLGIYDDNLSGGKTLDELWSEQTHEMFIDGRPVNLQAFGAIDFNNPMVGTVRVWNVVIVTDKPGKIKAHSTGIVGGDPFGYIAMLTFSVP
jgi:hypothetical protein